MLILKWFGDKMSGIKDLRLVYLYFYFQGEQLKLIFFFSVFLRRISKSLCDFGEILFSVFLALKRHKKK